MNFEIVSFIVYFAAMLGIGIFFFFKSSGSGEKDYFLGGRSMGPWVTAMSAQASDMSAWLLMGLPGSIMAFGFGKAWIGIGLALGTAANWIFVAKRLRRFSKAADDSITLPQYLSNRFAAKNPALKIVCAIVFLVFFTVYVASSFVAGTKVFTMIFPSLTPNIAMLIFVAILILYTFLGGFKAVCWTDFFQGLLMLVALLAVPIVIVCTKDLDTAALSNVITGAKGDDYAFVSSFFKTDIKDIISGLTWGLGYFGMPHILVRFMSIKKPSMVKKSAVVAIVWVVITLAAAIIIAYFGRMLVGEELLLSDSQETIFMTLARKLFPAAVSGILLAAIIAASMSTADSQLLVASSSFTSDIYKPVFRKKASDKELLWIGRAVVCVVAIVAYFIAFYELNKDDSSSASPVMNMVDNAWGGFGAAFGPVVLLTLFWKRFTYKGALAGIIAGAIVDVAWLLFLTEKTGIYELLPGFIAGLIVAVVVSLIDKKPSAEVVALYERATDESIDD